MTQTLALLVDSYRELNSKKLFWISLLLSGLVVAAIGGLGITPEGITVFGYLVRNDFFNSSMMPPDFFYKTLFAQYGVGLWLGWGATILAVISTAGIVPDMIASGSIELVLSKPIGRLRLFVTKYVLGLLFVTLQVSAFALACFLVIGLRAKLWMPSLFLCIPIVVAFFSYLFSVCALLGMITRSTLASALLTFVFWLLVGIMNMADTGVIGFQTLNNYQHDRVSARLNRFEREAKEIYIEKAGKDAPTPTPAQLDEIKPDLAKAREQLAENADNKEKVQRVGQVVAALKFTMPKTDETIRLLNRYLTDAIPAEGMEEDSGPLGRMGRLSPSQQREIARRNDIEFRSRGTAWILGSSFAFEGVVFGVAAWMFRRRDF